MHLAIVELSSGKTLPMANIQAQIREAFYELAHELVQELPVLNPGLGDIHLAHQQDLVHLAADVDHAAVHPLFFISRNWRIWDRSP